MTNEQLKKKIEKHSLIEIPYTKIGKLGREYHLTDTISTGIYYFDSINELLSLIKEVVESVIPEERTMAEYFFNSAIAEMKDNLDKLLSDETKNR